MTDKITLAHGAGGELYRELVEDVFVPAYGNETLGQLNDSAVCPGAGKIAVTTDSFVISPLFFPGGDIGRLSVCGTVNDLSVSGAVPAYLTVGMIIEAGFETEKLKKITASIAAAAKEAGVKIVTGDTKVVESGKADGIYINTAGVGFFSPEKPPVTQQPCPGDVVIASSFLGEHGTAVMTARAGMSFSPAPKSDVRPINGAVAALLESGAEVHAMRDPTRGGAAAVACEWCRGRQIDIELNSELPVSGITADVCALLGIDPLFVADEGAFIASVKAEDAEKALSALKKHPYGENACVIGRVSEGTGKVWRQTELGVRRRITLPAGEILPRIC